MSKGVSVLVVATICTFIGGSIGFLFGAGYSGYHMKNYLLDANAIWLAQHIGRLAMIRTGRVDDSAADIEKTLDNSIIQLSSVGLDRNGEFHAERLPDKYLRVLKIARFYADAGYRDVFSEESLRILDKVESADVIKACSPAVREALCELQERARE